MQLASLEEAKEIITQARIWVKKHPKFSSENKELALVAAEFYLNMHNKTLYEKCANGPSPISGQ